MKSANAVLRIHHGKILLPVALALTILCALPESGNTTLLPPTATTNQFRSDRILIKPRAAVSQGDLEKLHQSNGNSVRRRYPAIGNLEVVQLPAGRSVDSSRVPVSEVHPFAARL